MQFRQCFERVGIIRIEFHCLIQLLHGEAILIRLLVGEAKVVVKHGIIRCTVFLVELYRRLKLVDGRLINAFVIVGPA